MKKHSSNNTKRSYAPYLVTGLCIVAFAFKILPQEKWLAPAEADKKTNPIVSNDASIALGKTLYGTNCKSCHGGKGKGDGPKSAELTKAPGDFTREEFKKQSDGAIFWKVTEGKKPMPTFKKELTEDMRWQVINYIRTLGGTANPKKINQFKLKFTN